MHVSVVPVKINWIPQLCMKMMDIKLMTWNYVQNKSLTPQTESSCVVVSEADPGSFSFSQRRAPSSISCNTFHEPDDQPIAKHAWNVPIFSNNLLMLNQNCTNAKMFSKTMNFTTCHFQQGNLMRSGIMKVNFMSRSGRDVSFPSGFHIISLAFVHWLTGRAELEIFTHTHTAWGFCLCSHLIIGLINIHSHTCGCNCAWGPRPRPIRVC